MSVKKWILIVDDDEDLRTVLAHKITSSADTYYVVQAADGQEAKQKLSNQVFDCIVTDLNMPRISGQEFISMARSSPLNKKTPIIVITGFPDVKLEEKYEYLRQVEKPFNQGELMKAVDGQIKLGPINQRIPLQLFNLFIGALINDRISKKQLKVTPGSPAAVNSLGNIHGDHLLFMRLQKGENKYWICLGFSKEFVEKYLEGKEISPACIEIGNAVYAQIKKRNTTGDEEQVNLVERLMVASNDLSKFSNRNAKGISLPLETDFGALHATAMVGSFSLITPSK